MLGDIVRFCLLLKFRSRASQESTYYDLLGLQGDTKYTSEEIESAFISSILKFEEGRVTSNGEPPGTELSLPDRAEVLAISNSYLVLRKPITRSVYDRAGSRGIELLEKPSGIIHEAVDKFGIHSILLMSSFFVLLVLSYVTFLFCRVVLISQSMRQTSTDLWTLLTPVWSLDGFFLVNAALDLADTGGPTPSVLLAPYLPMLDVTSESFANGWNAKFIQLLSTCVLVVAHVALCWRVTAVPGPGSEWSFVLLPWALFDFRRCQHEN